MFISFKKYFLFHFNYHILILAVATFIALCLNHTFNTTFDKVATQVEFTYLTYYGRIIHIFILALALEILCLRFSVKYILGFVLLLSSVCGFYMDSLGIVINEDIIQSVFNTHTDEALDMISFGFMCYVLGFGILPCFVLSLIKIKKPTFIASCKQKILAVGILSMLIALGYITLGKDIIFIFKTQKNIEGMLNPIAPIRSGILYIQNQVEQRDFKPVIVAQDATLAQDTPPQIVLFVIGESTRSANFALNGYTKPTNPYTSTLNVISFDDFYSCGVITAISVPCMLTHYTQKTYTNRNLSLYTNNILDIAQDVGYEVWYLGNNGGKCVGGCDKNIKHTIYYPNDSLDGIMLPDIKHIIENAQKTKQNTFIIAHGYGSHGASYALRYPPNFEHFNPVCKQKELSKCTYEEIVNAYDNSLLYNDWFLAQIIHTLKQTNMRSMLWYVSDHGESLGELGQYMHGGLGYTLAPKYQKHIPSIMWFSTQWGEIPALALAQKHTELNHDYIFHTLLHLLGIQTQAYDKHLDILNPQ
ncbi:phosphoethanolamine transferase [Helicobacter japonicus]|uniref:phosphoethanolamine transferase n=1 Tax=Helicobacter japonicus TaxID=425400 RepID=UPI0023F056BF|nr:sulfatase-like hydrolase/transferase [Helicobacter japonicus]